MKAFWRNFLTGLLVIMPAFVTFTIIRVFFLWVYSLVIGPVAQVITPWLNPGWTVILVKAGILVGFFLFVTFLGMGTRMLIFRELLSIAEAFMKRVPVVGKIYQATREIVNAFKGDQKGAFSQVILLEWPAKGLYTLGFVTSKEDSKNPVKSLTQLMNVYVPTTPNPATGHFMLIARENIIPVNLSVEEGMKLVISGGVVGPEVVKLAREG